MNTQSPLHHQPEEDKASPAGAAGDADFASASPSCASSSPSELLSHVAQTIAELAASGIPASDLEPLFELQERLRARHLHRDSSHTERRRRRPASEALMGRACALIDLFIFAGATPEQAAGTVSQQLALAGVTIPEGGDRRAWKRLLIFRNHLLHGSRQRHHEARDAYLAFKKELSAIPAEQRVQLALKRPLWDQRNASR